MVKKFLKEEKAQAAMEYILVVGGVVAQVVVIFTIYQRILGNAAAQIENANQEVVKALAESIQNATSNMAV